MTDSLLIGLSLGCIYGVVAMGFSLAYRTTGVLSFAQGSFVLIGAMLSAVAVTEWGTSLWVAMLIGVAGATVAGLVLTTTIVLPLWKRNADAFVTILATALFLTIMENLALNLFGSQPRSLPPITEGSVTLGSRDVELQLLYIFAFTAAMAVFFPLWLRKTRLGSAMRACAVDREAARLVGVSPRRTALAAFGIAAMFTGLAGFLIAPVQFAAYNMGMMFNVRGFIAAMLGGLGNVRGALFGGLLLGLSESVIGIYLSSTYLDAILLLLAIVIVARPQRIFALSTAKQ